MMRFMNCGLLMCLVAVAMFGLTSSAGAAGPPPGSEYGISAFITEVKNAAGEDETRASAHPHSARARFEFNTYDPGPAAFPSNIASRLRPIEDPRSLSVQLPAGFVGNPRAAGACPVDTVGANLSPARPSFCPEDSYVGWVRVRGLTDLNTPVVNVVPEDGYPAEFGFSEASLTFPIYPELRSDSDYGVNMNVPAVNHNFLQSIDTTFCSYGVEMDFIPNNSNFRCREKGEPGAFEKPFLTNSASECPEEPPVTILKTDSWTNPGDFKTVEAVSPQLTSCDTLEFDPSVDIGPTTGAPDTPTGLEVEMSFPQEDNAEGQAPAALKKAVVRLPEGMSVNPAAADGLQGCADGELLLKSKSPMECPEASKIGEVSVVSPLLDQPVEGGVYLRSQNSGDSESGEMFRLALVLQNKLRGVDVRLPGQVRVDETTGRIEATFDNNPELPVSDIEVTFKSGPRAPLVTPPTCGTKTVEVELTSWGGQTVNRTSDFEVDCVPNLGAFNLEFQAGTRAPVAGESSPFSLLVAREDQTKELKAIKSVRLPEGLLGRVASVPLCGEVQAAAGTCSEASRVGHVQIAAGAGPNPLWVPQAGREPTAVYLSGPYREAPYSLSIVVPAQAGPFDLGRVVVRAALHVDERTARITSGVDETRLIETDGTVSEVLPEALPRILKGVVLNQREIRLLVDREDFMMNPTDCSEQKITAELYSFADDRADVDSRFQASDCAKLGFKPRLTARILDKGRKSTLRSWHPRTRFTVTPRAGDANIGGARVALPSSTILDQSNIGTTCTRAQMADRACPAKSVVGYAKAWSPLLREVVEGPVYLAANGGVRPLPDLAAVLDGEVRVVLQGEVSTLRSGGKARLQNTFRVVPDAPVTRFELTMRGGKNTGLLVNSTDLCRSKERGVAAFVGQNNRRSRSALRLIPSFKGCVKARRQAARKAAKRKVAARKAARRKAARH